MLASLAHIAVMLARKFFLTRPAMPAMLAAMMTECSTAFVLDANRHTQVGRSGGRQQLTENFALLMSEAQ